MDIYFFPSSDWWYNFFIVRPKLIEYRINTSCRNKKCSQVYKMVTIADYSLKNLRPAYAFHTSVDGHRHAWAGWNQHIAFFVVGGAGIQAITASMHFSAENASHDLLKFYLLLSSFPDPSHPLWISVILLRWSNSSDVLSYLAGNFKRTSNSNRTHSTFSYKAKYRKIVHDFSIWNPLKG